MAKTKNTYIIPIKKKDFRFALSFPVAHNDFPEFNIDLTHAIDFLVPEKTEVLAARKGRVVNVKVDSNKGGDNKKYQGNIYLNSISIDHENGEVSEYAHLFHNGSLVKVGDFVETGQVIGYSGNTGYSTEPHLHFHVIRILGSGKAITLEIQFNEKLRIIRTDDDVTQEDRDKYERYKSENSA